MVLSPEQKRAYLTKCHIENPEFKTQYGTYRVRVEFDDKLGVILSAANNDNEVIGAAVITKRDYDAMSRPLSLGWAYDKALNQLERCALGAEGFFTKEGVA